jgi:hypothetical protein
MTSSGQETVLYTFTGGTGGADGANPDAGLLQDAAGNLYGATYAGGAGSGVIFKPAARRRCSTPSWAAPMARIPMAA